jgi:sulfate transport system permease protein
MSTVASAQPVARRRGGGGLSVGVATGYLSVIVLLPLAALAWRSLEGGWSTF